MTFEVEKGSLLPTEKRYVNVSLFNNIRVKLVSFPGSPRARTKNGKERGEPGKIYHVRNVIGRENLWANEFAHALIYSFSRESFMADRTGLDSTMLHYLAVQQAMVSVHRPAHSKITLTYRLAYLTCPCWPTMHC